MNKVVILAAGKGKRMRTDLTKPAVNLADKPIIEYLVSSVIESGVDAEPVIVVSLENQEIIKNILKDYPCQYAIQKEALGTGHALSCAKDAVGEAEYVLSLYGDHPFIRPETIKKIFENHNSPFSKGIAGQQSGEGFFSIKITTTKVFDFDGWRKNFYHWGRIVRENNEVKEIVEFKDALSEIREIKELNVGFYRFETKWLWENISKIKNENASGEYYLTDLVKIARDQNLLIDSMEIDPKEAIGINSLEELKTAENLIHVR